MTDLAVSLPTVHDRSARPDWLGRLGHHLRAHLRLARRRRVRDAVRTGAHDWLLALPQSRHGG